MKVYGLNNYSVYSASNRYCCPPKKHTSFKPEPVPQTPCFKGSNVGKIAGFVLGAAAVAVFAPGVAMVGLAGLGALPGMMLGDVVDKKIDKYNK